MTDFEDRILLKLKRKYSKDEEIGLLVKHMRQVEYENGLLKSENAELKYNLTSEKQPPVIHYCNGSCKELHLLNYQLKNEIEYLRKINSSRLNDEFKNKHK